MIFVNFVLAFAVFMVVGAAAEGISAVVGMVTRVAEMPSATAAMASGVRIEGDNVKIGAKAACFCDFIVTFAPNVGGAGPLSVAELPCSHAASASDHEDSNGMNQKIYNLEDFATQYHLSDIFGAYAAHLAVTAGEGATLVDMMAERTLIVVTDCDLFKLPEEQRTALIALLNDFPPYCCLVFVYDLIEYKPSKTYKKLYEALDKNAQSVKFEAQERSDLINWIGRRFRALGKGIDAQTAEHLIFTCGALMTGLVPEIEKIGAYAKGKNITTDDINAVADPVLDAVVFDMTNAITKRDYGRASELLGQLLKKQEEPFVILAVISKELRRIYTARIALDNGKDKLWLMELWGMRSDYPARLLMEAARKMTSEWCSQSLLMCQRLDQRMKSEKGIDSEGELKLLLMRLAQGK